MTKRMIRKPPSQLYESVKIGWLDLESIGSCVCTPGESLERDCCLEPGRECLKSLYLVIAQK